MNFAEWLEILAILMVFIFTGQLLYAVVAGIVLTCVSFIMKYTKVSCMAGGPISVATFHHTSVATRCLI